MSISLFAAKGLYIINMNTPTNCPKCKSENVYQDGNMWVCPECAHEWNPQAAATEKSDTPELENDNLIRDAFGTVLNDGDSVTVIKELKIKGSSSAVKVGTKVRSIRLIDAGDGHDIACKIDGIGAINLKSEFVKKA
jgi:protein PhnA